MYAESVVRPVQMHRQMAPFASAVDSVGAKAIFTVCTFVVGTMGIITPEAVAQRDVTTLGMQYKHPERTNPTIKVSEKAIATVLLDPTPDQNLARIREVLKPTVLELANLFGVSRQAVYDWQAGAQPSQETSTHLAELARAADVFSAASLSVTTHTLRRKVAGGTTLLEAIFNQGNAVQLAQSLVETLQRESNQKVRLAQQVAGRKRGPANPADFGAPSLSEAS